MRIINTSFEDTRVNIHLNIPTECPLCGQKMIPELVFGSPHGIGYLKSSASKPRVVVNYRCTNDVCKKYFTIEYSTEKFGPSEYNIDYLQCNEIKYSYLKPITVPIDNKITKISPNFLNIYKQATRAESLNLTEISGIGYRKSLEFLVKDYLCHTQPENSDGIQKAALGTVINNYLNDESDLQNLAQASTWIGNGETHYINEYNDDDVQDMKSYIIAFASTVISKIAIEDATNRINQDRSSK